MNDTLLTSAEMRTFNTRLAALTSGRLVVGPDPITRSQARALWQATKVFAAPVAAPVAALAPLRSPRRRGNELHRTGAVLAISAVALSGCATLGGNVKGSFACRAPDGICAPTSTIDDQALAMISGADPEATPAGVINPYDRGDPRLTPVSARATPTRSSEKVLRIVFPAHIDGAGRYREASAIHAVVERGAWMAAADRPASVVGVANGPPREQVAMLAEAPSLAELAAASPEVAYAQPLVETPVALAAVPLTATVQNTPNAPSAAAIAAARQKLHVTPSGKPAIRAISTNTLAPPHGVPAIVPATQYAANVQARVSPSLVVQPALPRPATASSSQRPSLVSVPSSVSSFDLRNAGTASPLTTIRDQVSSILARGPKSPPVASTHPSATERPVNGPSVLAVSGVEK